LLTYLIFMKIRYVSKPKTGHLVFVHLNRCSSDGCNAAMKSSEVEGSFPAVVPILPLRDMVVFPGVLIPLFLKGSRVVKLAETVVDGDNLVGLFYQKARNRLSLLGE